MDRVSRRERDKVARQAHRVDGPVADPAVTASEQSPSQHTLLLALAAQSGVGFCLVDAAGVVIEVGGEWEPSTALTARIRSANG